MKKLVLAAFLFASPALSQEIIVLPAPVDEAPLAVSICAGGLGVYGAAVGASLSNPATATAAALALIMCSIVVESELPD